MAIRIPVKDSAPSVAFEDAVQFVLDLLGGVPEFRSSRGRQIELHGTLALIVLAAMAGLTRYRDVEEWGKLREDALAPLLGLVRIPSDTTIGRIIKGVDAEALRKVLRGSAAMILADKRRLVTAKDGKVMPGASAPDQCRTLTRPARGSHRGLAQCAHGIGRRAQHRRDLGRGLLQVGRR